MATRTAKPITADTAVVISRTVTVSTEWTLQDLADITGEDIDDVVTSFANRAHADWLANYRVAEMVPDFNRASEADGDVLDTDVWTATVRRNT